MLVSRVQLHSVLSVLGHVVDAKASLPAVTRVRLRAHDGQLSAAATDLSTWVRATLDCTSGDIDVAVAPSTLISILKPHGRSGPDGQVLLQLAPDGRLIVATDDGQVVLESTPGSDWPADPADAMGTWKRQGRWRAADLAGALEWVAKAVSRDKTRPHLCGVYVDRENVVATDGHRLHLAKLKGLRSGSALLPVKAVEVLMRTVSAANEVVALRGDDLVRFKVEPFEITAKANADLRFPPYEQVIPSPSAAHFVTVVETAQFRSALVRLPRARAGRPGLVRLRVNGAIVIEREAEGAVSTSRVAVIESTHTGEDSILGVDPVYLCAALTGGDVATIRFGGALDPIRVESGGHVAIVMPARL